MRVHRMARRSDGLRGYTTDISPLAPWPCQLKGSNA
jgi:hypothetical protein